jgi:hypothetical protein
MMFGEAYEGLNPNDVDYDIEIVWFEPEHIARNLETGLNISEQLYLRMNFYA